MRGLHRGVHHWRDPILTGVEDLICRALALKKTLGTDTNVELEVRMGSLSTTRSGAYKLLSDIASPVLLDRTHRGQFVTHLSQATCTQIESSLQRMCRSPTSDLSFTVSTESDCRVVCSAVADHHGIQVVGTPVLLRKTKVEYIDVQQPKDALDIRLALSTERTSQYSEALRQELIPSALRVRWRKSFAISSVLRVDVSQISHDSAARKFGTWWHKGQLREARISSSAESSAAVEIEVNVDEIERQRRKFGGFATQGAAFELLTVVQLLTRLSPPT